MRLSAIITIAAILLWFGAINLAAHYISEQIAGAMDRSANQIAGAGKY